MVVVFTLGVCGLTGPGAIPAGAWAGLCFLACAVVVGYGIRLIVPQLH